MLIYQMNSEHLKQKCYVYGLMTLIHQTKQKTAIDLPLRFCLLIKSVTNAW